MYIIKVGLFKKKDFRSDEFEEKPFYEDICVAESDDFYNDFPQIHRNGVKVEVLQCQKLHNLKSIWLWNRDNSDKLKDGNYE